MRRTPLLIRAGEAIRSSSAGLAGLPVPVEASSWLPVSGVAEISRVQGVVSISREKSQRFAVIRTNVVDRDLVGFVDEARELVAKLVDMPPGYYLEC